MCVSHPSSPVVTHTQNSTCKHKTLVEHLNVNLTFLQGGGAIKSLSELFFPHLPSSDSSWGSFILSVIHSLLISQLAAIWEMGKNEKQNNKRGLVWVMRRDGGGLERKCGGFGQEEMGRGCWMVLSFKLCNQPSNAEIYLSSRTHSEPHMSFNMYADGQAVTQTAPIRASSG